MSVQGSRNISPSPISSGVSYGECLSRALTRHCHRMKTASFAREYFPASGSTWKPSGKMTGLKCGPHSKPAWRLPRTRNLSHDCRTVVLRLFERIGFLCCGEHTNTGAVD